ncbi:uncharacterized protein HMPREF1541_03839 [Cyphellophora europaea CBS 101466]|uniref:Uncharacterized protein n=1 Tax=Cyphellophora europaea (strain CBS 101466) TaxID=1220924 RepID=W2RZZ4_CYPE1|nr:uncharacterized protein HMPREF1541_03839 [Cyphellophora europaea CBS 101466]ETN41900.1 hypothetical protein HMPREF1541_03839 [Cyphellophora europaea CBS 101466]
MAASSTSSESQNIPLPPSLTSTTSSLPTATQRALISHLRTTNALPDLSAQLADSLARTGWTDRVRALSLELLRNGSCDTFPELMEEVMRRAKIPRDNSSNGNGSASTNGTQTGGAAAQANGTGTSTPTASQGAAAGASQGAIVVSKEWSGGPDGLPDIRIPEATVEVGVDFLKDRIKDVVEVEEGG